MPVNCINECNKLIRKLERNNYFSAAFPAYNSKLSEIIENLQLAGVAEAERVGNIKILSFLSEIMRTAQPLVEEFIQQRVNSGLISDASQARKSAAGNIFQQFVAYTMAKNVVLGNIEKEVIVTTSTKKILDDYAVIKVGDDVQKPDSDVLIYSPCDTHSPIINFSCKTSCRERAWQTFKWKLLCDIATCNCDHKSTTASCPANRYHLEYHPQRQICMCFVTSDFYDEIGQPQIAAMFNFFDKSYVAKPGVDEGSINSFENVIDYINSLY